MRLTAGVEVLTGPAELYFDEVRGVMLTYIDVPFNTGKTQRGSAGQYVDSWPSMGDYIAWLRGCVASIYHTMAADGVICVHCDWRTSHHIRLMLDSIFRPGCFVNSVVWCYNSGGASKRWFARKHDDLLIYSKRADGYKFNVQREPYATPDVEGRPGFHPEGRMLNDWWQIPILSTTAKTRTGWPNQKPEALLERLIVSFTDPGDLVADWFCGSGTTAVAAFNLGRRAVVCDREAEATEITMNRLLTAARVQEPVD